MIIPKPFFYLRHGQTDFNLESRFQGSMDIPLNKTGMDQAHAAREILRPYRFNRIYSSPLVRAWKTAEIVNSDRKKPLMKVSELAEMDFGDLEGRRVESVSLREEWLDGAVTPPGGENYLTFTKRALGAINRVLDMEGTPLIVAHGGIFWPVAAAMELTMEDNLPNARPAYLYPSENGWKMDVL